MKRFVQVNTTENPIYGMGLIGAAIYFIMTASSFWLGILGILKAIFWPAVLVYEILRYFNA
ncbi:MAG: hypothetical protein HYX66_05385 [Ignavibacteria bacterium]|nr:hypothetical protein [Ignavibacteria bacterium]